MLLKLLIIPFLLIFSSSHEELREKSRYLDTRHGPVIEWQQDVKLKWSDFKAKKKSGGGFAVASSTCGFGYDGVIEGDDIQLNVYVRFYCNESWHHKNYKLEDVLQHEQLHFDICELYGRKFYKEILKMREKNKLNQRSLESKLEDMMEEYDSFQNQYDKETDHSTNTAEQKEWEKNIKRELYLHTAYSDYREF